MDDVRYYVMSAVRENVAKVMERSRGVGVLSCCSTHVLLPCSSAAHVLSCCSQTVLPVYQSNVFTLLSNISVPSQESELANFMVKQAGESGCLTP